MAIIKMILTNGFDPDLRVYKEAKYLISQGHEVEIICWDRQNKYKDKPTEIIDGINITRFFMPSQYGTGLKQLPQFFKFGKAVKKYLKNKKYDVLHCHDLDGAIIGKKIKGKSKLVFDMHEYYINKNSALYNKVLRYQVASIQNKADYIIYLNDKQKQDIAKKNIDKLIYLPNYPEAYKFADCTKTPSDKFRIGYAGYVRHLGPLQNLFTATKCLDQVQVDIYGASVLGNELEKLTENNANVKLYGEYNHNEIAKIYKNIDLLFCVYVAKNENDKNALPTKFYESIISETPIMVSKDTLMADFVNEKGNGYIVNGDDAENMEQFIKQIINDKNLYNEILQNIKAIKNDFKWETVVTNIDKIFNN